MEFKIHIRGEVTTDNKYQWLDLKFSGLPITQNAQIRLNVLGTKMMETSYQLDLNQVVSNSHFNCPISLATAVHWIAEVYCYDPV